MIILLSWYIKSGVFSSFCLQTIYFRWFVWIVWRTYLSKPGFWTHRSKTIFCLEKIWTGAGITRSFVWTVSDDDVFFLFIVLSLFLYIYLYIYIYIYILIIDMLLGLGLCIGCWFEHATWGWCHWDWREGHQSVGRAETARKVRLFALSVYLMTSPRYIIMPN